MDSDTDLDAARRWFARDIGEVAPVLHNPRIIDAFAAVPREDYLGTGPWDIHSRLQIGDVHRSATASPHHLYHDVLIAIDRRRGINNGLPSLWARVYDHLGLAPGATVCQIGAGVGYYTAILAELVGQQGRVVAYEIDAGLAARAAANLAPYANVTVIAGDATLADDLPACDALTACAGVTHLPDRWRACLKPQGQCVLAFTGIDGWGHLLHFANAPNGLPVTSLGPVGIYPCAGARSDAEARALSTAFKSTAGPRPALGRYHPAPAPATSDDVWVAGDAFWISRA